MAPWFISPAYWWLDALVVVGLIFMVMLFVAEPLFLHRWFLDRAKTEPEATFRLIEPLHWVLLVASLIAVIGAVAGSHGLSLAEKDRNQLRSCRNSTGSGSQNWLHTASFKPDEAFPDVLAVVFAAPHEVVAVPRTTRCLLLEVLGRDQSREGET